MLDQAFERFPGEVEAVEARIFLFQGSHHAQRLGVVIEATGAGHGGIECALAGMTERRMAEIVGECQGFGQIFIDAKGPGNRPGDLRDLKTVGQARAVVIALVIDEHLGLVVKPPEGHRVQDAVAIARVRRSRRARRLRHQPPATRRRVDGIERQAAGPRRSAAIPLFCGKNGLGLAFLLD
jgi:hypothetical protein